MFLALIITEKSLQHGARADRCAFRHNTSAWNTEHKHKNTEHVEDRRADKQTSGSLWYIFEPICTIDSLMRVFQGEPGLLSYSHIHSHNQLQSCTLTRLIISRQRNTLISLIKPRGFGRKWRFSWNPHLKKKRLIISGNVYIHTNIGFSVYYE